MGDSSAQYDPGALGNDTDKDNADKTQNLSKENVKERLKVQLFELVTKKGHLIKITLDYFDGCDDVQYYLDKIMDSVLKSPYLVEEFTKEIGLISCLKDKGEQIKNEMFKKIQLTYIDMKILMDDSRELSVGERQRVRGFCDLLGCVYSRFRVKGSEDRFKCLARPAVHVLSYLLNSCQQPELMVFNKLMRLNYSALEEEAQGDIQSIAEDLRSAIAYCTDNTKTLWLMSALDISLHPSDCLPSNVYAFYSEQLGDEWTLLIDHHTSAFVRFQEHSLELIKSRMNEFDEIDSKISQA